MTSRAFPFVMEVLSRVMNKQNEKWAILGASRGLGRAFVVEASQKEKVQFLLCSRKLEKLKSLVAEIGQQVSTQINVSDFTQEKDSTEIFEALRVFAPDRIFYFAGGGPHGNFEAKAWKDHEWAFKLNLLFPASLLHESFKWPSLKQMVFVGSSIAEAKADPFASSYASAKHGLKGLVASVKAETNRDLRLFSPGYCNTDLLPHNAKARQSGQVWEPKEVAETLLRWCDRDVGSDFHLELLPYSQS